MKKLLAAFIMATLALAVPLSMVGAIQDKDEPVQATDIELVKKVTAKGSRGQGKPTPHAATGIPVQLEAGKNRYAIIIGISDYPGTANDLKYGHIDAIEMYNISIGKYGFTAANTTLLINESATRSAIDAAINNIKVTAQPGDEVVFFFSGHGAKGKAADGDRETIDESIVVHDGYIWDGALKQWFDGFATDRIVFIFDSCLSGGMTDLRAPGRIIAMASTENGYSYEFDSLQNGQFTYYFAEQGMVNNKADKTPQDGLVTVEEAFDYARANCIYQTPTISDLFTNDLLI